MGKKLFRIGYVFLFLLLIASACGSDKQEGEYKVYYLSMDWTKTIVEDVDLEKLDAKDMVSMLLVKLQEEPERSDARRTIPENIKVGEPVFSGYQITVDLSKEYYELGQVERVLMRAAIVKTLTQIEDYVYVSLTVDGEPMINDDGSLVRSMSKDSFVENPGKQINSSNSTVLTLYFANKEGTGLVKEECEVHYSSNISLDKLVMTKLIEGPQENDLQATLPSGTKIVMISVADGICYVNLDDTFKNDQNNEILEQVVLYSIVNSLTELPDVDKVQISINGDTNGNVRYNYSLSTIYERDDTLIVSGTEEVQQETEEGEKN